MKKLILLCLLLSALPIVAQRTGQATTVRHGAILPATCDPTAGQIFQLNNDGLYSCTATNTWTKPTSSGGTWGSITGTLSSQTDLQTALNGKVPTTTTVNGHALSSNVALTSVDIEGLTSSGIPSSGLLAEYHFQDGSGTTLSDSSGNGNNGTLCASTAAPVWTAGGVGLTFDGSNDCVSLPSALNAAKTIILFTNYQTTGRASFPAVVSGFGGTTNWALDYRDHTYSSYFSGANLEIFDGAFKADAPTVSAVGNSIVAWERATSTDRLYLNGNYLQASHGSTAQSTAQTGGNLQFGGGSGASFWAGTIYFAAFYNTALTDNQIALASAAIQSYMAQRGITIGGGMTSPTDLMIADGDSISSTQSPYTNYLTLVGSPSWTIINTSISSTTAAELNTAAPIDVDTYLSTRSGRAVVVFWAGTNDIAVSLKTPAEAFQNIVTYCRGRRAKGYKVIVATMLSRSGQDANKNTLDGLIRQYWPTFADGLADVASSTKLGADGAYANVTYFYDSTTHPSTASDQNIVAPIIQTAVNSLYGNHAFSSANTATGAYTQTDVDQYLNANPAGGNVTVTLESCERWMGQPLYIKNIQTSGANTVTVAAGAGLSAETQLIDGAASVTVPNNTVLALQAKLVSSSAAGCNWTQVQNTATGTGGSGTVNSGTINQLGYYAAAGTAISGNSATVSSGGKIASNGGSTAITTVTFSATPTFDASVTNTFALTLTGNVTSSTLSNATAGQSLTFILCQDATGSRTFAWPVNVIGAGTIIPTASKCSMQSFKYDGTNAYATGSMVDNGVNGGIQMTEGTGADLVAGTGTDLLYPDSTAHRLKMNNNNGGAVQVVGSGVDINTSDQVTATHLTSPLPLAQGGSGTATPSLVAGTNVTITGTWPNQTVNSTAGGAATTFTISNAGTTGTTLNTLTKLTGAPSTAVIAATTDTGGVVGITSSGAGTTGSATITYAGTTSCIFDAASTAGDYVQISPTTAGNCHDAGATYPTSGQVLGRVLATSATSGSNTLDLFPSEIKAASGGSGNKASMNCGPGQGLTSASATTYYIGGATCTTDAPNSINSNYSRILVPASGNVTTVCVGAYVGTPGTAENVTWTLEYDGADTTVTGTIQWNSNNPTSSCVTGASIAVVQGHWLSVKEVTPTFVTAPSGVRSYWSAVIN